jgi:hypothetical protein
MSKLSFPLPLSERSIGRHSKICQGELALADFPAFLNRLDIRGAEIYACADATIEETIMNIEEV